MQVGFRTGIGSRIAENGQPEDEVLQLKDVACGTRTCEVWIALQPQIRLEYYAPETTQSVQSSQDVYTEIYTYIDGEYVLTDSYTRTIESTDEY